MDKFKVYTKSGVPVVEDVVNNFRFRVVDSKTVKLTGETAVLEATLYAEQGGFVPVQSYLFELVNSAGEGTDMEVNIDDFKTAVDFFFNSVLGTDLFVKSIPKASTLCPDEVKQYQVW
ncbi:hypothetical protein ACFQZS_14145 [Mucilaginibacter calamicampi]|uniref:Uncharacterized protein n=1 Tax=Mucilaginibacter calamicampi TaxID=1302352 RepID=A0ABW2Z0Q1_9SPHI